MAANVDEILELVLFLADRLVAQAARLALGGDIPFFVRLLEKRSELLSRLRDAIFIDGPDRKPAVRVLDLNPDSERQQVIGQLLDLLLVGNRSNLPHSPGLFN